MRWLISIFFFLACYAGSAQDSCKLRISLLTCSPGAELYSIFGHSALRIVDSTTGTDIVYNYGTFDFDDPDFYSKFVRGKLLYYLSQNSFSNFKEEYAYFQRSIDEQVLNFSCENKQELQRFVFNNLSEENKYYRYDFLYDNCTTRLRDIIEQFRNKELKEGKIEIADGMSFRNGIHYYLDRGHMHWSKFGIDLLLGSRIDKKMTNREAMFLPEFLENSIDRTGIKLDSLVEKKEFPLRLRAASLPSSLFQRPELVFTLLAAFIIALSMSKQRLAQQFLAWFDKVFFLVLGLLGCLFLFMWVGTDHKQTVDNYNLLWAWPTHIALPFLINNLKPNVRIYLRIYIVIVGLTLLLWVILPQQLNPALIPVLIIAIFRALKINLDYDRSFEKPSR